MSWAWHFREVSGVCRMHSDTVFWLLYASGQLSADAVLACTGKCLDLRQSEVSFNQACAGLLVKRDLMLLPLELKFCRRILLGHVVHAEVSAGHLEKGPDVLGLMNNSPVKAVPAEHQRAGLDVSRLCSQCWHCPAY